MKIDEREKFLIHFQVLIFQITINRFCAFCTLHDSDIAVIINGCLEELDPVVMALRKEIQSGNLPRDHIFLQSAEQWVAICPEVRRSQRAILSWQGCRLIFRNSCLSWQGQDNEFAPRSRFQGTEKSWNVWLSMERLEPTISPFQVNQKQRKSGIYH